MWLFVQTWLNLARAKKYRKNRGANTGWRQSALAAKSSLHKAYMSTCLVGCPWYSVFFWRWFDFAISCNFFAFWFLLWSLHTIEMIICQRNPLKFETWDSACHFAHVALLQVREGDNFMLTVDLWLWDVVEHDNHSLPWQLNLLAWRSSTTFCWQGAYCTVLDERTLWYFGPMMLKGVDCMEVVDDGTLW